MESLIGPMAHVQTKGTLNRSPVILLIEACFSSILLYNKYLLDIELNPSCFKGVRNQSKPGSCSCINLPRCLQGAMIQ